MPNKKTAKRSGQMKTLSLCGRALSLKVHARPRFAKGVVIPDGAKGAKDKEDVKAELVLWKSTETTYSKNEVKQCCFR